MSTSLSDFWRKWHISFSSFLVEYVYIPLGGNRKGNRRRIVNTIITMLISGVWHGGTFNFIFWGFMHGILMNIQNVINRRSDNKKNVFIKWILTFCIVNFLWVPFRIEDMSIVLEVYFRIFTLSPGIIYIYSYTIIFIVLIAIISIREMLGKERILSILFKDTFFSRYMCILLILITLCFGYFGDSFFIYSSF